MLPFKNRLTKRKNFEKVSRYGKFFSFGCLGLKIYPNGTKETRIGLSVGLKFSKSALQRNRAKRQLREAIRKRLPQIKKGFDVVVLIRAEKDKASPKKLETTVQKAFETAGLIN